MGINTGLVITFSYALSSMTAAFAGVLIAPLTLTGATMGAVLGLKAFAVAIIGGLNSGMGVIVGGLILGIAETTTGYYISTGYKDVPGLLLLLLVLTITEMRGGQYTGNSNSGSGLVECTRHEFGARPQRSSGSPPWHNPARLATAGAGQ